MSLRSSAGISAYRSRDAFSRLPSRCARSALMRAASSLVLRSPTRLSDARSRSQRACSSSSRASWSFERLAQGRESLLRGVVLLLLEGELFELEAVDVASQLVDLERGRVDLHAQAAGRLVDQVDRLVGSWRTGCSGSTGMPRPRARVGDRHLVVRLVALLEPAEDRDGVLDAWARRRRPAGSDARARHPSR